MPHYHDRHREEDPQHPDDCACRECRPVTMQEHTEPDWEAPPTVECDCSACVAWRVGAYDGPQEPCRRRPPEPLDPNPANDTHLCSGGPEEITDEEWDARAAELGYGEACPNG